MYIQTKILFNIYQKLVLDPLEPWTQTRSPGATGALETGGQQMLHYIAMHCALVINQVQCQPPGPFFFFGVIVRLTFCLPGCCQASGSFFFRLQGLLSPARRCQAPGPLSGSS